MPNSLTDKELIANLGQDEEEEERTNEQIKKDLENVEDIFAANVFSAKMGGGSVNGCASKSANKKGSKAGQKNDQMLENGEDPPEEEWLSSSNSDDAEI